MCWCLCKRAIPQKDHDHHPDKGAAGGSLCKPQTGPRQKPTRPHLDLGLPGQEEYKFLLFKLPGLWIWLQEI